MLISFGIHVLELLKIKQKADVYYISFSFRVSNDKCFGLVDVGHLLSKI